MPRWRKNQKEFTVSVSYGVSNVKVNLPKPLAEFLGKPDKITFKIEKGKVKVES